MTIKGIFGLPRCLWSLAIDEIWLYEAVLCWLRDRFSRPFGAENDTTILRSIAVAQEDGLALKAANRLQNSVNIS